MNQTENEKLAKISIFFYTNGLNMSGGKKSTPKEENIPENSLIDTINTGVELSSGSLFVRGSFRESRKYFEFPIEFEAMDRWNERMKIVYQEKMKDMKDNAGDDSIIDF